MLLPLILGGFIITTVFGTLCSAVSDPSPATPGVKDNDNNELGINKHDERE